MSRGQFINFVRKMERLTSRWEQEGTLSTSSPVSTSSESESAKKSWFCFICSDLIENRPTSKEEGAGALFRSSTNSLEVFLNGLDVFCEALQVRKPFSRDDEWRRFAQMDNFVLNICCAQCYSLFKNVLSLHELILSTKKRLKGHVHAIENHIVKSFEQSNDEVEYFESSCIRFRNNVLENFHGRTQETVNTHLRSDNCSSSSVRGAGGDTVNSNSHSVPRANSSKQFNLNHSDFKRFYAPEEEIDLDLSLIKCEETESSEDSQSFKRLESFSCEEGGIPIQNFEDQGEREHESYNFDSDRESDSDSEYVSENESECLSSEVATSSSSVSEEDDFIPDVKQRKILENDPLECNKNDPERKPCAFQDPYPNVTTTKEQKRGRGRPRKYPDRSVPVDMIAERPTESLVCLSQDAAVPIKRKRGRPRKYPERTVQVRRNTERKCKKSKNLFSASNDATTGNELDADDESMSSSVRKGKKPFLTMWKTNDYLLQHGPSARPILVLDSDKGEMSYLHSRILLQKPVLYCRHPECNFSVNNVISFSEQEAYLEIKRHIRDNHRKCDNMSKVIVGPVGGYCCYYCDSVFFTGKALHAHTRTHHQNLRLPDSLCEICGITLQQKLMHQHVNSHKNYQEMLEASQIRIMRKPHKNKTRKRPLQQQQDEMENEVEGTEFCCEQCGKIFHSSASLRSHQTTHVDLDLRKKYECDICHAKLSSATSLKYHRRDVHFKSTYFTCNYCGRQFTQSQQTTYQIHVRLHTGERPYQCSVCGNSFVSRAMLRIHEKSHEDTKIQCEYCPNEYKTQKALVRHQKKNHSEFNGGNKSDATPKSTSSTRFEHRPDFIGPKIAYPCEPCGKVYRWKSVFVAHMKTKHKLQLPSLEDYPNQIIL